MPVILDADGYDLWHNLGKEALAGGFELAMNLAIAS
jgi:hypothetical protein